MNVRNIRKYYFGIFLLYLFVVSKTVFSAGPTYHSGYISSNETWYAADNPHIVTGDVTVRAASSGYQATATLNIEAGCEIRFHAGTGLFIGTGNVNYNRGALYAGGTSDNPIIFTSSAATPSAGDWKGIYFYNGTYDNGTVLSYCTVEYGGNTSNANIYCNSASPYISDCIIKNSSGYGIYCDDDSSPYIANNTFTNNTTYPISMYPDYVDATSGNTGSGNGTDAILVRGGYINSNASWVDQGLFYLINADVTVRSSSGGYQATATLNIEAGCEVRFHAGTGLYIGTGNVNYNRGALYAGGTAGNPVIFTSSAATPTAGDWKGIYFYNGTYDNGTALVYCTIEYGGNTSNANISCNSASPYIANCIIQNSSGSGIYLVSDSSPTIGSTGAGNTITNNNTYGIYCNTVDPVPYVADNNITNNGTAMRVGPYMNLTNNTCTGNTSNVIEVIGGYVYGDNTWRDQNTPYKILGDVTVRSSSGGYQATATLNIEAGCEVRFNAGTGLFIGTGNANYYRGALYAGGTAGNPVIFTSSAATPTAGDWKGIYFYNGTYDNGTALVYCMVEYGGNSYLSNIYCNDASPYIYNSTIRNSSGYGIYCDDNSAPYITDNTFNNNTTYPISMYPDYVDATSGNTGSGNGTDAIQVRGGFINTDASWVDQGLFYLIHADVTVRSSSGGYQATAMLYIAAGCEIRFHAGTGLYSGTGSTNYNRGALYATGTSDSPVIFTSNAAAPSPGDWKGIYFYNGTNDASTLLNYCTIEYGGNTYGSNVYCNNASPYIQYCIIKKSSNYGIYTTGSGSNSSILCSAIKDNEHGVYAVLGSKPTVNNCTITGNNTSGITSTTGSSPYLNAYYNWWGSASGPSGVGSGSGDAVSNYVDYDPWLESTQSCVPTVIELVSFTAKADNDGNVILDWETASEIDSTGFNLYRAKQKHGTYEKINENIIASEGNEVVGANYRFEDNKPGRGSLYYKLEDVDSYGVKTMHGPVKVRVKPAEGKVKR